MLVEVAVKRPALCARDGGEVGGVVGGGVRDDLHDGLLSVLNDRSCASGGRGWVKDRAATAQRRWGSRFSSARTGANGDAPTFDPPKKMVGPRRPGGGFGCLTRWEDCERFSSPG